MKIGKVVILTFFVLLFIAGALIGFFSRYYSIFPSIANEIFPFGMGALSIGVIYVSGKIDEFWELPQTITGMYVGFFLNISLSTSFIFEPSIVALAGFLFFSFILLWSSYISHKTISWRQKLTFIFLGCWIVSLASALIGFVDMIIGWLSLLPLQRQLQYG